MSVGSKTFRAVAKARGVTSKLTIKQIDRGWERISNDLRSIQTDKSYVKAGLLAGKAGKPRKAPRPRLQGPSGDAHLKALVASNPVLLAVIAARSAKRLAAKKYTSGRQPTNVELGIIHEFGQGRIPARPFIRPAFARHKPEYLAMLRLLVQQSVMTGKRSYVQSLGLIGQRMSADMKNYVTRGPQIPPPNSGYPDTKRGYWAVKLRRGHWKHEQRAANAAKTGKPIAEGPIPPPRTLVDTGRMVGAITYGVVARSTGDLRRAAKKGK